MRRMLIALALTALAAAPAAAQDKADVVAVVHKFVDSFNSGYAATAVAACAEEAAIIDEFPPYEWHGMGACSKWMMDYNADADRNGITEGVVTLGTPLHVDVSGTHAYVVVPAKYAFKQKGRAVSEDHSLLTVALRKEATGWRMTAWAWSKG